MPLWLLWSQQQYQGKLGCGAALLPCVGLAHKKHWATAPSPPADPSVSTTLSVWTLTR